MSKDETVLKESNELEIDKSNEILDSFMNTLYSIPGVKVKRNDFLKQVLSKYTSQYDLIDDAIEKSVLEAGYKKSTIDLIAKKVIKNSVFSSTRNSFISGIPGGFAMAATIPADTAQFYAHSLTLAQKLAYLYGFEDLWDGEYSDEEAKNQMMIFLGVMFGISGSTAALKVVTANLSNQALKKLPQKALTKTIYYPIIKKICKYLGINLTKKTFAKGVSKTIPIIGGAISGGLTYTSLSKMGDKLQNTLSDAISESYSVKSFEEDFLDLSSDIDEVMKVDFEEIEESSNIIDKSDEVDEKNENDTSIIDQLDKLNNLKDSNAISEEEFELLKIQLIQKIK